MVIFGNTFTRKEQIKPILVEIVNKQVSGENINITFINIYPVNKRLKLALGWLMIPSRP